MNKIHGIERFISKAVRQLPVGYSEILRKNGVKNTPTIKRRNKKMINNVKNIEIMTKAIKEDIDLDNWSKLRLMYEGYSIGMDEACVDCAGPWLVGCAHVPFEFNYWVARNSVIHYNTSNTINTILRKNKAINKIIEDLDNIEEKLWLISMEADDYIEPLF